MQNAGFVDEFHYRGVLDREKKIEFLRSLDVLSVPATYDEPKGIFLLEAMASGVPVVQPRRGAFPEMLRRTGGGLPLVSHDPAAPAPGIFASWKSPPPAAEWAPRGAPRIPPHYTRAHTTAPPPPP